MRILLIILLVIAAVVTGIWLRVSIVSRRASAALEAREVAAVRTPSKPPLCSHLPSVAGIPADDPAFEDIRIFRFVDTLYFIPDRWLNLDGPGKRDAYLGIDRMALGIYDPDLHRDECRGIVHRITSGPLYMDRHVGIAIDRAALPALPNVLSVYFHKLRPAREALYATTAGSQTGDLVDGKTHMALDAYVRLSEDVAVRLQWHPAGYTARTWSALYRHEMGNPKNLQHKPSWAWDGVTDTKEFRRMTAAVHAVHGWLSTPPNARPARP